MNSLVYKSEKGNTVTNSKLVAEKFEKRHEDVLRAIRNLECSKEFHERNFALLVENKQLPQGGSAQSHNYIMTRDGFSFLAMGFTGREAAKFKEDFINAFNKMEQALKQIQVPQTFAEALRLAAEQAEKIENQERQLIEMKPKALFADSVNASNDSILIADLAKLLKQNGIETGEKRLFEWMRTNGYLCSKGEYRNTPTQRSMELGLFEIVEHSLIDRKHNTSFINLTTKVTGKGQLYFINKFLNNKAA